MDASFARTHRSGCCEIVTLAGELDMASAPELGAVLDRMMVIPDHIVVDASRLEFVDSTGLAVLLRASQLVDGRISIRGASHSVLRMFEVSGTSESFCLIADPDVAHGVITRKVRMLPI